MHDEHFGGGHCPTAAGRGRCWNPRGRGSDRRHRARRPAVRADIHVAYAEETVLADVSLALEVGGCLTLAGANGSCTSTLLCVCVGRQQPDRGEVRFAGSAPREADPVFRRDVGLLLDGAEYFPDLTVAEHVRMVATAHGLGPRADAAADRVLAELGLDHGGDAFPDALSAGQRQMLLLASVLVRPARLLVVDEPEQRLDTAAPAQAGRRAAGGEGQVSPWR
ncbi:ABC transporter ATP-binding protein [Streptomyces nojiriensis]|uniref:ABC transporter ATP-binding protein n=1 Tax=Streptomyces nojiriensis TaxID=66374 RepID=UPI0035E1D323